MMSRCHQDPLVNDEDDDTRDNEWNHRRDDSEDGTDVEHAKVTRRWVVAADEEESGDADDNGENPGHGDPNRGHQGCPTESVPNWTCDGHVAVESDYAEIPYGCRAHEDIETHPHIAEDYTKAPLTS